MVQCFSIRSKDLDQRLDCFFYQPEFTDLEKRVKKITKKILNDYIISISSGETPNKNEKEKYYVDSKDKGVYFLRVQNVTPEGLKLDNSKFINEETHNSKLKRSQVNEYDLLTKITGVGRMAVSAVAPKGFEGNINQHLVVIQTKSLEISNTLANFLNSDIGERLAFRRTTGGTRPALDYKSLKSIPIVYKPELNKIMDKAYSEKINKENEAIKILNSINEYILSELEVEIPKNNDKMTFPIHKEDITGRIDPFYYKPKFNNLVKSIKKIPHKSLDTIVGFSKETWNQRDYFQDDFPYIEISEIDIKTGEIKKVNFIKIEEAPSRAKMIVRKDDIIISTTRPHRGAIAMIDDAKEGYIASTGFSIIREIKDEINKDYLFYILRSEICLNQMLQRSSGGNYPAITQNELKKLKIPIPKPEIQEKIVQKVYSRINKAKRLQLEANEIVFKAKNKVNEILLDK
jgi:type I restriction enzyme S subunit